MTGTEEKYYLPVVPVFFGYNKVVGNHVRHYYRKYGVKSNIFDNTMKVSPLLLFRINFYRITSFKYSEIIIMTLRDYAEKHKNDVLILIPASGFYNDFIRKYEGRLEDMYIIDYGGMAL